MIFPSETLPIPDLHLPQHEDTILEQLLDDQTIVCDDTSVLTVPRGTPVRVNGIWRVMLARWTGSEWIFLVRAQGRTNDQFVRATENPRVWEAVDADATEAPPA